MRPITPHAVTPHAVTPHAVTLRAVGWSLCALLALGAAACQVDRGQSDLPDQQIGDAGADADTTTPADAELGDGGLGTGSGAGTMTGTWLLYHERSTCLLGQEQLTHATYVMEIEQHGATVSETRHLCSTELSEVFDMQVRIPQNVLESIDFVDVDRGVVSTLRVGGSYVSSTEVALWGLDLEDPAVDPVPDSVDDPRVIDSDADGHPAVSFQVGSDCQRYQGQRQVIKYHGTFTTPNQIDGSSTGVTDLKVYGGSDDFCTIAPAVASNDAASRFRMVRVDGKGGSFDADTDGDGQISCAEAMAISARVLDDREADNANCQSN